VLLILTPLQKPCVYLTPLPCSMDKFNALIDRCQLDKKQFQLDGAKWCLDRELDETENSIKGGIIADEMGLGKTILMIGIMHSNPLRRTLIVLPVALIKQWAATILQMTGQKPLIYHDGRKKISKEALRAAPIVLTTYNIVTICALGDNSALHTTKWSRVIYDEGHHLRNSHTTRHAGCAALTADITWIVTGTPIQNKASDLFSLCAVIGIPITANTFKSPEFKAQFLHTYVLKRTKVQVGIALPPLTVTTVQVPWSNKTEQQIAMDIHKSFHFSKVSATGEMSDIASALSGEERLSMLIRARQSCVMPSLMVPKFRKMHDDGAVTLNASHMAAVMANSKICAVVEAIISRKDNGAGKLVFCHYIKEIDEIATRLTVGGISRVLTYDGRNSRSINILTEPADVIILQIQTGCEGLNLQANYSEIYFASPHWNPAIEDQAIARCYRIGQQKEVNVFKFIMENFDSITAPNAKTRMEVEDSDLEDDYEDVDVDEEGEDEGTFTIENYINLVQNAKRETIADMLEIVNEQPATTR
jgi:SNF2 family DNA or RNA helicase